MRQPILGPAFLLTLVLVSVLPASGALAEIDPTQPVTGPYASAPIRNNFQAALNDINALRMMNASATAPFLPTLSSLWMQTSTSPYTLNIWDGTAWVPQGTLDTTLHRWTPLSNGGPIVTGSVTSTVGHVVLFNSTNGAVLSDGGVTVATLQLATSRATGNISASLGSIVNRMGDRLFVGKNANVNDGNIPEAVKDWAETLFPNSTSIATISALGQLGGIGILGGVRTSDGAVSGYASATTGFCVNDNTLPPSGFPTTCTAGYLEGLHPIGGYGSNWTHGLEIDIDEMNSGTVNGVTFPVLSHPFSTNPNGMTTGLILASGGSRVAAQPATTALRITSNVGTFETAMEIRAGALIANGGFYEALAMPASHKINWYGSDNVANSFITSIAGAGSMTTGLTMSNGGVILSSSGAAALTLQNTGAATDQIFFNNGVTNKYVVGMDASNNFLIFDAATSKNVLSVTGGVVSIGETGGTLTINSGLTTGALSAGASTLGATSTAALTASAHLTVTGPAPGITSGFGTGPSRIGSDTTGRITVGSGGDTSGLITFGTAFSAAPACTAQDETTSNPMRPTATTTQLTITGTMVAADKIVYHCLPYS